MRLWIVSVLVNKTNNLPSSCSKPKKITINEKRWLVVGIALCSILSPGLRPFVENGLKTEYANLKASHHIDSQTSSGYLKKCPTTGIGFCYKNINPSSGTTFDYKVRSAVDLARLYLPTFMAKFTAFNEECDTSAVLNLLGKVPTLSGAKAEASVVRENVRNEWAHCDLRHWTETKLNSCFDDMNNLAAACGLSGDLTDELKEWKMKGNLLMACGSMKRILLAFSSVPVETECQKFRHLAPYENV